MATPTKWGAEGYRVGAKLGGYGEIGEVREKYVDSKEMWRHCARKAWGK